MLPTNIDLKALQAFYLVARLGSVRNAAAQLGLTVPAVSIRIRRLEEELGVSLFDRAGKRLILARAGELFLVKIGLVFETLNAAVQSVAGTALSRERIAVGMVHDLTGRFVDSMAGFIRGRTDIDFALRVRQSPEILGMVLEGEMDLGIGYFGRIPPELNKLTVGQTGFSLLCDRKHPLAGVRQPSLKQITAHRLIGLRPDSDLGRRIAHAFAANGLQEPSLIESGSCHSSLEFAERKVGLAIVHTACLPPKLPPGLCRLDATAHLGTVEIGVIHRRRQRLSEACQALLHALSSGAEGAFG